MQALWETQGRQRKLKKCLLSRSSQPPDVGEDRHIPDHWVETDFRQVQDIVGILRRAPDPSFGEKIYYEGLPGGRDAWLSPKVLALNSKCTQQSLKKFQNCQGLCPMGPEA